MEGKTKISKKKVAQFAVGSILVVIFLIALVAASRSQGDRLPQGLEVSIVNENEHEFINKKDIEQLLRKFAGSNYLASKIKSLDLNNLEKAVEKDPWVVNSDVFVDNSYRLHVQVTQRVPVARIFNQNGVSWYMDSTLKMLPVSARYAYPAPVFTNVPIFNNDSFGYRFKAKIAYLSSIILNDNFWNAQITQIEVQPDQTFVLTPMLGNHKILFGDTSNAKSKFENLLAFYEHVSKKIGWDKYQVLDIRFAGQVVASPAMGYTPPAITDTSDPITMPPVEPKQATTTLVKPAEKPVLKNKAPAQKSPVRTKANPTQKKEAVARKNPEKKRETNVPGSKKPGGKYIYQGKK